MNGPDPHVPSAAAPPPAAPPRRPLWARAAALVTAPRSVFEELAERPSWFWTAVAITVFAIVVGYLIFEPVIYPYMLERVESQNLSSEALARAETMYSSPGFRVFSAASAGVANFVFVVVLGLLLFGVCSFLLGGRASVKQAISVGAHASLVHVARSLLVLPVMLARRDPTVSLGPGALFPPSEAEGFGARALANFLGGLDLFSLWALALCVLGMAVVARLPVKQVGVALGIGYLAAIVLLSLGGAALQR